MMLVYVRHEQQGRPGTAKRPRRIGSWGAAVLRCCGSGQATHPPRAMVRSILPSRTSRSRVVDLACSAVISASAAETASLASARAASSGAAQTKLRNLKAQKGANQDAIKTQTAATNALEEQLGAVQRQVKEASPWGS